jgi:hypothetical protein
MKHTFLLTVLLVPTFSYAQYNGGSNDGVSSGLAFNSNPIEDIYYGGSNDGHSSALAPDQNVLTAIYGGGINDGVSSLSVSSQNVLPGIYLGGINDGFSSISAPSQNTLLAIYTGGVNDGVSSLEALNQNAIPGIYFGGSNDGISATAVLNNNPLASIYKGGNNDGVATINLIGANSSVIPLPISLLRFAGNWFNDDAVLNWETGTETNLDHFELERSLDGGLGFDYIASINPNSQPNQHDYRFTDVRAWYLSGDFVLYRLKVLDKSGKISYSGVAKLTKDKTQPAIVVYPNPTSGHFTLAILNASNLNAYSYLLTSADGKVINRGIVNDANTSFDLSAYAAATYHLFLLKDGKSSQHFTILLTQ